MMCLPNIVLAGLTYMILYHIVGPIVAMILSVIVFFIAPFAYKALDSISNKDKL